MKDQIEKFLKLKSNETFTHKEVGNSKVRVNVYAVIEVPGSVVLKRCISRSYYLNFDSETNTIKDLTI